MATLERIVEPFCVVDWHYLHFQNASRLAGDAQEADISV